MEEMNRLLWKCKHKKLISIGFVMRIYISHSQATAATNCTVNITTSDPLSVVTCVSNAVVVRLSVSGQDNSSPNDECQGQPGSQVYSWTGNYLSSTNQATTTFSNAWTTAGVYTNTVTATIKFYDCLGNLTCFATATTNVITKVIGVALASSNPTNACVSYKYVNPNCTGSPPLINETNSITLTATGTPDDGTGSYTWSHPRGGMFSTNGVHIADTVVYTPPALASATPSTTNDKVAVIYTYHGVSCTNQATLNILRPTTMKFYGYSIISPSDCTETNIPSDAFQAIYTYFVLDQYGRKLSSYHLSFFETFDNFAVGKTDVGVLCPYTGIQIGFFDGCPVTNSYSIYSPGSDRAITTDGEIIDTYMLRLDNNTNRLFWNSTSATRPAFKADHYYTIQGANFLLGTDVSYCNGTELGAYLLRNGALITNETLVSADN